MKKTLFFLLLQLFSYSLYSQSLYPFYGKEKATKEQLETALPIGLFSNKPMQSRCNSFLISDNLVVTNNHCVEYTDYNTDDLSITFNYNTENEETFNCGEVLYLNKELDLAILRVKGNPGKKYNSVIFSQKKLKEEDDILVIHYNNDNFQYEGDIKLLFSEGKALQDETDRNGHLIYKAFTLPGTSGSPVFYKNKKKYYFIGLHNVHYEGKVDYGTMKGGNSASQIYDIILSLPDINSDDIELEGNKYIKTVTTRYSTGEIMEVGKKIANFKKYVDSDLGNKLGKWNAYYKNGTLMSQKFYKITNGFKTGKWVYFYENGNERIVKNYAHNLTKEETYKHLSEHGMLDGEYISKYDNDKIKFKGNYTKGEKKGEWNYYLYDGELIKPLDYDNRDSINLDWVDYHNNGVVNSNGRLIKGEKEGVWLAYTEKGDLYSKGEYFKGKKEGIWKTFTEKGELDIKQSFINGKENGFREYYKKGKVTQKYKYSNDKFITGFQPGITTFHGKLIDNVIDRKCSILNNRCLHYFKNGEIRLETYFDNEGNVTEYLNNYLKDGTQILKNGTGIYKDFYENGSLKFESEYNNGIRDGISTWYYENGQIEQSALYKYNENTLEHTGLRWEILSSFKKDGASREKGTLKNGNGTWISYDKDGNRTSESLYKNGIKTN